ncbi:MAG: hypothetical protein KGM47_12165 [Acidobacteriota bacterium]|nr:hypothetical protein [Acidobacteriota bacterium]
MAFAQGPDFVAAAWQTQAQVYYARIDPKTLTLSQPVAAPGHSRLRKYPALAINSRGDTHMVWTNASGWVQGGSLGGQIFGQDGRPIGREGNAAGVPPWSFGSAFARP